MKKRLKIVANMLLDDVGILVEVHQVLLDYLFTVNLLILNEYRISNE
jgi:hypothetical protein